MQTAPSRNAPCPCGSGKKYKRCCGQGKPAAGTPQTDKLQQLIGLYQQGNLQAAGQLAEQLLRGHPEDATLLEIAAVIAMQQGRPQLAIERFKRQLQSQPTHALAHSNLCMVLHSLDRDEEAFQHG